MGDHRKVLTVNHVFELMLRKHEGGEVITVHVFPFIKKVRHIFPLQRNASETYFIVLEISSNKVESFHQRGWCRRNGIRFC